MMIGLPGDTLEKSIFTTKKIIELGADNTRIYPALVIRDTKIEKMYADGKYQPLPIEDAVSWSKEILLIFEEADVKVIKLGLHPSEGLLSGEELIAGPFHPSFRELVLTEIWNDLLKPLLDSNNSGSIEIGVSLRQYNYAVGYGSRNKKMLLKKFKKVRFIAKDDLKGREFVY